MNLNKNRLTMFLLLIVLFASASYASIPTNLLNEKKISILDWKLIQFHLHDLAVKNYDQRLLPMSGIFYDEDSKKIIALFSIEEKFTEEELNMQIKWLRFRITSLLLHLSSSIKSIADADIIADFLYVAESEMIKVRYSNGSFEYKSRDVSSGKIKESLTFDLEGQL